MLYGWFWLKALEKYLIVRRKKHKILLHTGKWYYKQLQWYSTGRKTVEQFLDSCEIKWCFIGLTEWKMEDGKLSLKTATTTKQKWREQT